MGLTADGTEPTSLTWAPTDKRFPTPVTHDALDTRRPDYDSRQLITALRRELKQQLDTATSRGRTAKHPQQRVYFTGKAQALAEIDEFLAIYVSIKES